MIRALAHEALEAPVQVLVHDRIFLFEFHFSTSRCSVCLKRLLLMRAVLFLTSYLLPDKGRSSKQKTPVLRRTCSPVWNYTFMYDDVSLQELSERSLELTVWDHDRLASNEFLGGLRFNLGTGK